MSKQFTGDQLQIALSETESEGKKWSEQALLARVRRAHRRAKQVGKHTRVSRTINKKTLASTTFTWHETKPLPEDKKAKARKARKAKKKQQQKARRK